MFDNLIALLGLAGGLIVAFLGWRVGRHENRELKKQINTGKDVERLEQDAEIETDESLALRITRRKP